MKCWQLQEAKAKLSELVRTADRGPQAITVHGEPTVVILSKKDYDQLCSKKQSFVEFMRNSPLVGAELSIEREKGTTRDIDL